MRLRPKLTLAVFGVAAVPLICVVWLTAYQMRQSVIHKVLDHLVNAASIQSNRIEEALNEKAHHLELIASRTQLRLSLKQWLADGDPRQLEQVRTILADAARALPEIVCLQILSLTGQGIAMAGQPPVKAQEIPSLEQVLAAPDQVVFTLLTDETQSHIFRCTGLLHLEDQKLGLVVVDSNLSDLKDITSDYSGLGNTGETVIGYRTPAGPIVAITPTRSPERAPEVLAGQTQGALPLEHALAGDQGPFLRAVDYRGIRVFAAGNHIARMNWGVVVKIDRSEALAPMVRFNQMAAGVLLVVLLVVLGVSAFVARRITTPLMKLRDVADAIRQGDWNRRARVQTGDEIQELAEMFNKTTDALVSTNAHLREETQERAASEAFARKIVDASPHPMLMVDQQGRITLVNQQLINLLGFERHELLGQVVDMLLPEHLRQRHAQHRAGFMLRPTLRPMNRDMDLVAQHKDGTQIPLEIEVAPIHMKEKMYVLASMVDIRERMEAQRKLQRMNEQLSQANHQLETLNTALVQSNNELDDFAHIASHDLKEPLRGMSSYAQFLQEDYPDQLDDEGKVKLQTIQRLAQRMEHLIDSLLYYSRLGRVNMAFAETDLDALVRQVLETLRIQLDAKAIDVRIPKPLPRVVCDPVRVTEVFRNLITNAMKYNDKDQPWIEIGCLPAEENQGNVEIFYVKDNGIGIREAHVDKIFGIFKRLHKRDDYGGGTGIGLTIVQKIIDRHHGRIWVESMPDQGTTFKFTLREQGSTHDGQSVGQH